MPKTVLTNAFVEIDGTNLSNNFQSVTITSEGEDQDVTGFGPAEYREYITGFKNGSITGTAFQDYAAASLDAVLWPHHESGGTFGVVVRPDAGVASSTNPEYTMTCRLPSYSPLAGDVGSANTVDINFVNGGTAGLLRGTA